MSDIPNAPQEEVGLVALDLNEQLLSAEHLPPLTSTEAKAAYRMMMAGIVSRLFLYLYGEIDRQKAEQAVAVVDERLTVYREIVEQKVPPMRAVYEFLIKQRVIEREPLGDEADAHLDRKDLLQDRIISDELVGGDVVEVQQPPTYSVPAEVNVHWGESTVSNNAELNGVFVKAAAQNLESDFERTWDKIRLNCELPKVHSRYTPLYEPNKLGE